MVEKRNDEEKKGEYLKEYGVIQDEDSTIRMPTKGFPVELFMNWNNHCVLRHNNCRWEKMYSDHEKARAFEALVEQQLMKAGIPMREDEVEEKGVKKASFFGSD